MKSRSIKGQILKEGAYFKGPLRHKMEPINATWEGTLEGERSILLCFFLVFFFISFFCCSFALLGFFEFFFLSPFFTLELKVLGLISIKWTLLCIIMD